VKGGFVGCKGRAWACQHLTPKGPVGDGVDNACFPSVVSSFVLVLATTVVVGWLMAITINKVKG
jgi:hypothetical protein